MPEEIDAEKMLQVLEQVVEEAGREYVYERGTPIPPRHGDCSYLNYSLSGDVIGDGCLIGRALKRLGVSDQTLKDMDTLAISDIMSCLLFFEFTIDGLTFTPKARQIMKVAQNLQDCGVPWGDCLRAAMDKAALS